MQSEPSPPPSSWDTNQNCIHDLFVILSDKEYWQHLNSDDADMRCINEMIGALKKFRPPVGPKAPFNNPINDIKPGSVSENFTAFQRALADIATKPREESRLSWSLFPSDRPKESIMHLKIVVKNLLELDKSNDFDRLRIDYATRRKDNDMLVRAKTAMAGRSKLVSPIEKKPFFPRLLQPEHLGDYIKNNELITALFLYDQTNEAKKFNELLNKVQRTHPCEPKTSYVQDPTLATLILIIKDKSYWKHAGKTAMTQVIDRYETLSQKLRDAPLHDVAALQALDMALLKNLQALTPRLSAKQDNGIMLAAALHAKFDNFDDVKNSDGFKRLEQHHIAESADLKRVFRPGGRSL